MGEVSETLIEEYRAAIREQEDLRPEDEGEGPRRAGQCGAKEKEFANLIVNA